MAPDPRTWPDEGATLRPAAALLLIYPEQDEWHLPLTVRASGLRHHTSQVSLPGGRPPPGARRDRPDDLRGRAPRREGGEKAGPPRRGVDVLGRLPPFPI